MLFHGLHQLLPEQTKHLYSNQNQITVNLHYHFLYCRYVVDSHLGRCTMVQKWKKCPQDFLAATSSSRSDDVSLSVCLSVCVSACHLIFLAVNFAPLYFCPLHLFTFAPLTLWPFDPFVPFVPLTLCTFAPLLHCPFAFLHLCTLAQWWWWVFGGGGWWWVVVGGGDPNLHYRSEEGPTLYLG